MGGPEVPVAAPLVAPVPVLETPEVAKARAEHLAAHAEAKVAVAAVSEEARKKREAESIDAGYGIPQALPLTLPVPLVHNAPAPILNHFVHPVPVAPTPIAPVPAFDPRNFVPVNQVFQPNQFSFIPAPAPKALPLSQIPAPLNLAPAPVAQIPAPFAVAIPSTPSSQFHAQDEFGQFSFGYENINSAKTETKDAFGVTRGSYQYVDANGILQTVNYIADPVNGFRVAGTNIPVAPAAPNVALPVGPEVPAVKPLVAPVPVVETPEVAAARAEHLKAHEEAKAAVVAANEDKTEPTTEAEL